MDADWDNRLEALGAEHVRNELSLFVRRVQHEHAEADEGVAEEDGDGEKHHDEEDVDFLAKVFVG